ncbi:radical SAM protein [Vibrio fluvialis]
MDLSAPLRINIQLTMACNQDCRYCYNPDHKSSRTMSYEDFTLVSDRVVEAGIFKVALAGGEPFLHPQFFEIYEYISKKSLTIPIILTNGSVWNQDTIDKIRKIKQFFEPKIQVSLDSLEPIMGLQNRHIGKTVKFIETLIQEGIMPSIGTLVTKNNYRKVPDIVRYFGENIEFYHFMGPMMSFHTQDWIARNSPTDENIAWLAKELISLNLKYDFQKEFSDLESRTVHNCGSNCGVGCAAAYTHCVVTPELDVMACEITPEIIIGNLRENSFQEIWGSSCARHVQKADFALCHDKEKYTQLLME